MFFNAAKQIEPPATGEHPLAWAARNPDALAQLIETHNQIQNLTISVVQGGVTRTFPIMAARGGNAMIQLELPSS